MYCKFGTVEVPKDVLASYIFAYVNRLILLVVHTARRGDNHDRIALVSIDAIVNLLHNSTASNSQPEGL